MLYWRLAFRNLLRQRTRFILNLILLVGAFAAVVSFRGFSTHLLKVMRDIAIDTQYGHLQVAKKAFFANASVDSEAEKMLQSPEILMGEIKKIEGVEYVSARSVFFGLINTETKSIPARIYGFDPSIELRMQPRLKFPAGQGIMRSKEAILGNGLRNILKVSVGEDVTLVSPTLLGGINAIDVKTVGVFSTGLDEIDNSTAYVSLVDAKRIMDTDDVDRLVITIKDISQVDEVKKKIEERLRTLGREKEEVKTWSELAELFHQVEDYYEFQNRAVEIILILLLFLSVSNTVNMTVFERLAEIGTLRALGDYEGDIQKMFFTESICLAAVTVLVGTPLTFLIERFLIFANWPVTLPLASMPLPLQIHPDIKILFEASIVCTSAILLASIWPARRGSHTPIVVALRAKI